VVLPAAQMAELATLVEALLLEIAAALANGTPWRAVPPRCRWLGEGRTHRKGSRPAHPGCFEARLLQVCRIPKCPPGACLAARWRDRTPCQIPRCRGALHPLEAAALQHRAQHSDKPCLCWCLCFWPYDEQGQRRGGPQAHQARIAPTTDGMGRSAQGSASSSM